MLIYSPIILLSATHSSKLTLLIPLSHSAEHPPIILSADYNNFHLLSLPILFIHFLRSQPLLYAALGQLPSHLHISATYRNQPKPLIPLLPPLNCKP
ncbi:hypothetical protein M6B38_203360 [Iris pallida]|uniref:NADH dehydrogenase subunit 4 n=1 Tax=Iris pallida TaxID=29817 RepID=A0AAX6E8P4_IRIPA|nr:hypothetical protein M6B38_203360 [Iris pallida]